MSPAQPLPNFFIVGAPKAGTTSLYHHLDQHPQIYMSPLKEPCYFSSELRPENYTEELQPWITREIQALQQYLAGPMTEKRFGGLVSEWDDYIKLFRNAAGARAIGEASVCYLWSPTAARNIFARFPAGKIVIVVRDPVERAFSQHLHAVTLGATHMSFREQIRASLAPRNRTFGKLYPLLEFGLYYEQVKRYLDLFPPENVRIYVYEEYKQRGMELLADVFRFLDVETAFVPPAQQRRLEPRIPRFLKIAYFLNRFGLGRGIKDFSPYIVPPLLRPLLFRPRRSLAIDPADRAFLHGYYQEDIRKLSGLLNRDLARAWNC